jgi:competence protein ComEC
VNLLLTAPPTTPQKPPSRQPMLWAAVYAAGIVIGYYVWRAPVYWLVAGVCFLVSGAYFLRRRSTAADALALAALFVTGALMMQVRAPENQNSAIAFADGRDAVITAHVIKEGNLRDHGRGDSQQRLDVETEQINTSDENFAVRVGIRVSFYGYESRDEAAKNVSEESATAPAHLFRYGERLRFPAKLYPPRKFHNPGAFDYAGYPAENGIVALGSAKADKVELLPGFAGNRFEFWRTRLRRLLVERIHVLWKPGEAPLLDAMLLGENSFLGRETLTDFQRTGTYHMLVISGLKVAVLALVAFWVLRRTRMSDLIASAITVLLTVSYALLTDVGAPVWRATLMLVLYLGARLLYRRKSILINSKHYRSGSSGLADCRSRSTAGSELPTQLSVRTDHCWNRCASSGANNAPLSRSLRSLEATGYAAALSPHLAQLRLELRMIAGRRQRFFGKRIPLIVLSSTGRVLIAGCEFLVISTVLQAGSALPMAYYFHRATLVSLPANALAVPLTEIIMVVAILAMTASYASFALAKFPAAVAGVVVQIMNGSVRWLGGLDIADTRVPRPQLGVILLGTCALVLAMVLSRRRRLLVAAGWVVLGLSAFWICVVPPNPQLQQGVLELTAIDVGQGDSILLVSPQGRTLLVDAGGIPFWMHSKMDIGEDVVSSYLWSRGFHQLDVVALTHAHADHMGGTAAVLANFHPRELWLGVDSPSPELQTLLREAKALQIPIVLHKAGDNLEMGGTNVVVLAPPRDAEAHPSRPNDESLVIKISYGATSALLEGDAEKKTEQQVARESPQADLLKVAHHGSATSTIPELLAAVHPRFAVISVGVRNVYGHPRREVLERLEEAHVVTYRTDMDGAVTFYLDGKTVTSQLAAPH